MKISSAIIILLLFFVLPACKKSANNDGVICTGNSTGSYFPLAVGDSRQFSTNGIQTSTLITGQSGQYFYEESSPSLLHDTLMVTGNGDVYDKNNYYPSQFLLVPGSPQVDQVWNYGDNNGKTYHMKVLSLHESVLTNYCLYTNCLALQDSLDNNNVKVTFYAPGIGPVQSVITVGQASTSELSALVLK